MRLRSWLLLALLAPILACSTPVGVRRVDGRSVHRALTANVLTTGSPSPASTQVLDHLMSLSVGDGVPVRVQRVALRMLQELQRRLRSELVPGDDYDDGAQAAWELERIRRFLERGEVEDVRVRRYELPPGSPIGCASAGG